MIIVVLSWHNMVYKADILPMFLADEVPNVQSAVSFFENGSYQNTFYGLTYSSGIAVTWPSAVGWLLGKRMLASRIGCAFFSWVLAMILGFCFLRNVGYSKAVSLLSSVSLWAFTITSPFALPYWFGFMHNLGELNSVLLIGMGLLFITKNPFLSVFVFGVSVWHGKYIYLPLVVFILLGDLLAQKLSVRPLVSKISGYVGIFFLPLLLWLGWLSFRFDTATMKQWLASQLGFLDQYSKIHGLQSPIKISASVLLERLKSPELEWTGYSMGTKIKNLLFSFGPIGFSLISFIAVKAKKIHATSKELWISLMASAVICFYSVWYFFIHQYMWQRYFQPALYIGIGLLIYWGSKWERKYAKYLRPIFCAAVIFLLTVQVMKEVRHPLFQPGPSYARLCADLYGPSCMIEDE